MENLTDKSSEVLKAALEKAEEMGNSQGEYLDRHLSFVSRPWLLTLLA